jgi:hypothetical protein
MKRITSMLAMTALFAAAADATAPAEGSGGKAAKAEKPAKPAREKANGVTRPSAGTSTGKVWEIADSISAKENRPATRAEVVAAGAEAGLNPATVTTQFGQWRRFYGIKKEVVETKATKPAKGKGKGKGKKAAAESNVPEEGVAVVTDEDGNVTPVE